ncbi:MAG: aminotransferase IV [Planctomycetes bacterium]|nr:aminotransferase IV [Planctomycetota bacterium]MCP4840027.1 aminotransferase IV [Planctomycetota bacterium]
MLQTYDSRNADLKVNINGELLHRDVAGISPFDSLVQGGDGVWEGLRLYQDGIFKLTAHLDRLRCSARALAFEDIPSHSAIIHEIARTLEANGMHDGVHIRLTLSRGLKITSGMDPRLNQFGSTLIVLAEYKPPVYRQGGLSLVTSSVRRFRPDMLDPRIHHNNLLQSIMAKIEANAAHADDAMMLDDRGFIAETNATHLFFVHDNTVSTSRVLACPEGVTRGVVLDLCDSLSIACDVRDISQAEAFAADECFCTGTMGELAAVTMIDGRTIGDGSPGPIMSRLQEAFAAVVARECEPVAIREA